ncbi:S24 family peptidase [Cupriavidus gilardii]|uniref:S24 family peptidase n=1 Tax=Cupriavidus gilardii TaxID=82541 RepID=UPI0021B3615D|nr:S24 family peptidase [Cupriavidus gilardii]UXC37163.1 helix-turn-helix transcriptional regulator [Cupriavidus gilardii]
MKSIKEIRREKLAIAITEKCEGNQSRAADALGYTTASLVNRYVSGAKDIGDKTARKIEETFGYPKYWMDSDASPSVALGDAESLAKRVRFMLQRIEIPPAELAEVLGAPETDIDEWLAGTRKPSLAQATAIQERYQVNSVWLLTGKGQPSPTIAYSDDWNPIPIPQSAYRRIPVRAMAKLGDNGHFCDLEYPVGHGDGYLHFFSTDPDAYGLRCVGDSMEPRIKDGEFVVIEPNQSVSSGDEVLVRSKDGRVMIKILGYSRDGYTHLLSVNQSHKTIKIPVGEIEELSYVAAIVKASAWRPD